MSKTDSPNKLSPAETGNTGNLRFHRHPYVPLRFAAYDGGRVRLESETDSQGWGEFNRSGAWLGGPLRYADPAFCRWVVGEFIYNDRIAKGKSGK